MSLDTSILSGLAIFLVSLSVILLASSVLAYIFHGISYYTISKNRGYNKPWLAWIPIASSYLMGAVADDIGRRKGKATNWRIWLLVLNLLALLASIVILPVMFASLSSVMPGQGFFRNFNSNNFYSVPPRSDISIIVLTQLLSVGANLISLAVAVIHYIALYKIFQDYAPQNTVVFLVVSILIGIAEPFIVFSLRNKPAISIYGAPTPPYGGAWGQPPYGGQQPYYGQPPAGGQPPYNPPYPQPPAASSEPTDKPE